MFLSSDTLSYLLGLGLDGEKLVELVRHLERDAQSVAPVRSSGAARQARYRDNKRNSDVTTVTQPGDVTPLSEGSEGSPKPLPTPPNLSQEPPISPTKSARKASTSAAFDRFWEAYPRKVAKGRAERAFPKALILTDLQTLIDAALTMGRVAEDAKYIPNAASWLNDKRWLDTHDIQAGGGSATVIDADAVQRRREENRRLYEDAS